MNRFTFGLGFLSLLLFVFGPCPASASESRPADSVNSADSANSAKAAELKRFEGASPALVPILRSIEQFTAGSGIPASAPRLPVVCAEQTSGRILIFKPNSDWNRDSSILWSWGPEDSPEVKSEHYRWFSNPDECKPVLGTSHLLMTASGGGAALVRLSDKKVLFYANAGGNPHSAELLPDGNAAVVSSAGYFTVFAVPEEEDFVGGQPLKSVRYPIPGGHGVVWDSREKLLWVVGYTELAAFRYNFDKKNPECVKEISIWLNGTPAHGGHDLYPVPGARALFVTGVGIGVFDVETRAIVPISELRKIKSISLDPQGNLIVLSPSEQWWNPSVSYLNQTLSPCGTRDGARIYKARWWKPCEF